MRIEYVTQGCHDGRKALWKLTIEQAQSVVRSKRMFRNVGTGEILLIVAFILIFLGTRNYLDIAKGLVSFSPRERQIS